MAAPTGLGAVACPAYPWPHDGAQRGKKVFMQSDCAACHSMLPYASLRDAAALGEEVGAKAAEIVVIAEEAQPPAGRPIHGGAYTPDLTTLVTKVQEGPRYNLYSTGAIAATPVPRVLADGVAVCQELKKKMALPSPVWMRYVHPYMRASLAA